MQSKAQTVWQHLAGLFGADALERKFGPDPPPEWEAALSDLNDAQLHHGLQSLMRTGGDRVPTLPQFIAACRDNREFSRAGTDRALAPPDQNWELAGNRHLIALAARRGLEHKPIYEDEARRLWASKNDWAKCMRGSQEHDGSVDIETQKAMWQHFVIQGRPML
jgi:hypothetical protein